LQCATKWRRFGKWQGDPSSLDKVLAVTRFRVIAIADYRITRSENQDYAINAITCSRYLSD
jgi:hypothetical protein